MRPSNKRSESRCATPDQEGDDDRHKAISASLLIEGLKILGCGWLNNKICECEGEKDGDYELDLPPMVIRPIKGPPPKTDDWFSCPLIVAHPDSYGTDLTSPPIAHVMVRTSMHPAQCAIRGVRLVSYA